MWDERTGTPLLDLKGQIGPVLSVSFSPDRTRIVAGGADRTAKVWDSARTETALLELRNPTSEITSRASNPTGQLPPRTLWQIESTKVWDARSGRKLKDPPIPPTPWATEISPDGRWLARQAGNHVELIPLQADEEELTYRSTVTRPNDWRYRRQYEAARAANDDFAARFYLNLLPLRERTLVEAQVAADREVAAGRTPDALVRFLTVSAAKPSSTTLRSRSPPSRRGSGKTRTSKTPADVPSISPKPRMTQ